MLFRSPQIVELDINPLIVGEVGNEPVVADARMTFAPVLTDGRATFAPLLTGA